MTERVDDADAVRRALVEACPGLRIAVSGGHARQRRVGGDRRHPTHASALTHGDLWRQNVVLRDGRITCLLDFEHGRYADRFLDFGKLDEHIFDEFPDGRAAFLDSYDKQCALPPDWESRVQLGHAIHALSMCVYFLRWTPKWAPQYADQLEDWLRTSRG